MHDRVKSRTEQLVEQRTGRDLVELLREFSIERRYDDGEIADALGVSRQTVIKWRQRFGIDHSQRVPPVLIESGGVG